MARAARARREPGAPRGEHSASLRIADLADALTDLQRLGSHIGIDSLIVASSCSLQPVSHDAGRETHLDPALQTWLAFAEQKLGELTFVKHRLPQTGARR